eukprot:1030307-Prorocentrum_lima.AAC.1
MARTPLDHDRYTQPSMPSHCQDVGLQPAYRVPTPQPRHRNGLTHQPPPLGHLLRPTHQRTTTGDWGTHPYFR